MAPCKRRNSDQFIAHLEDLRRTLRCYRVIHVVYDSAPFHTSNKVRKHVARLGGRIVLTFLPKYAPETNPIGRVWWHLHETVVRNHHCCALDELIDHIYEWIDSHGDSRSQLEHFKSIYTLAA